MHVLKMDGRCNVCGERVRLARKRKGLSQEQLAARMQLAGHSITQKAVSRLESGERVVPDYEVPLLAQVLEVSPLWLLGVEEE